MGGSPLLAVAAISWQGYQNLGTERWLLAVVGGVLLTLIGSVVSYLVTGYHVVGRELRIYEGLISRRTRAIPVERLQSVELVRPVLARLCGLAELRLEVVGGPKTEAPLAFLTLDDAERCGSDYSRWPRTGGPARGLAAGSEALDNQGGTAGVAGRSPSGRPHRQQSRPGGLAVAATPVVGNTVRHPAPIIFFAFEATSPSSPSPAR